MKFPVTFKLKDFNIDKDEERPNWLEIFYNHLSIIQVSLFICTYNWSSLEIYIYIDDRVQREDLHNRHGSDQKWAVISMCTSSIPILWNIFQRMKSVFQVKRNHLFHRRCVQSSFHNRWDAECIYCHIWMVTRKYVLRVKLMNVYNYNHILNLHWTCDM